MVWVISTIQRYLAYERFKNFKDHAALNWLLKIADPSGRLKNWRLYIAEFDFEVKYKTGKENEQAEDLSRLATTGGTVKQI